VKGGYSFRRPPAEVTILEVVETVDGRLTSLGVQAASEGADCSERTLTIAGSWSLRPTSPRRSLRGRERRGGRMGGRACAVGGVHAVHVE